MKKNTIKLILGLTLCCMLTLSCKKDFLTVVPKGTQVASTTSDYNMIMNSPDLYFIQPGGGWQNIVPMGDEVAAEATYFNGALLTSQNSFKWAADVYQQSDNELITSRLLKNLYVINKVINEVMSSTGGTTQQKAAIQAEAYASRAYIYFQLINFYGKPYLASTASADPGFPIMKTADITATGFTRNSVQEVYDFIISDFSSAIAALPLQNPVGPTRFTKAAAEGLLGKVYLFMGRNADALSMLNAALTDNAASSTPAVLYNYNKEFASGGKFVPITSLGPANSPESNYSDNTESLIAYSYYNGPNRANNFETDYMVLSPQATALYSSSDLRLNFYGARLPSFTVVANPSGRLSKYGMTYSKFGLQLPDLYLLRAECKAKLSDLSGAQTDVQVLRNNRMPAAAAIVPAASMASQKSLIQFIFDERVREFALEGYRWFDMRRLSVDPMFSGQTYTHILYNDATFTNTTLYTLEANRLTLRLPPFIMNSNPQFSNNP